ncbi:hypothetical protein GZH49_01660 [Nocardia terpenica]|uniref:hypothetical protein n=1 Tax=Nocardia terpenica TaxID=455432 RepID=UPI002FE1E8B7
MWIDTTVYSPSDDDRDDEWDDHACRVYAKNHGLIVARTLVTSKRWRQPPLTVLRDHLRAHDIGIVVVPSVAHIDLDEARTFAEIRSISGGTIYTRVVP